MTNMNIEQLSELMRELRGDISRDSKDSLEKIEARITKNINNHIDEKFTIVQGEIDSIKKISSDHSKRILELEKHIRCRNIIFFAVEEGEKSYEELENKIMQIINNELAIECNRRELEMVRRMGRMTEGKIRPIVTTFTTYGKKIAILKNKHHLKEKTIYVKEDFPHEILETRKKLQVQLQKERIEGKVAFLRYDKLIVKEPGNQVNKEKDQEENLNKNPKKRELETTPPNQSGSQYTPKNLSPPKYQAAAKKIKVKKYNAKKGQLQMTNYLEKHSDTPAYNTALSSDESGE